MSSAIPTPEYKFADGASEAKSIDKVAKMDAYLVQYKDGKGETVVQLAFRFPKSSSTFLLKQKITNVPVLTTAHKWFNDKLEAMLQEEGLEEGSNDTDGNAESI